MQIIEMNEGRKIEYELNGTTLSFADGELSLNLARFQRDDAVKKDIMVDNEGYLTTGRGRYYAAQVEIPPREYEDIPESQGEDEDTPAPVPLPLDTDQVKLYLFSIEGIMLN